MRKVALIAAACFFTSGCGGVAVLSAARSIPLAAGVVGLSAARQGATASQQVVEKVRSLQKERGPH